MAETVQDRVTMQDLARMAGVSVSTVSRALNQAGQPESTLHRRVLKTADEVGYRRLRRRWSSSSRMRKRVAKAATGTVALLAGRMIIARTSQDGDAYHATVTTVQHELEDAGYHLILASHDPDGDLATPSVLQHDRVDGIILLDHFDGPFVARLQQQVPVVMLNNYVTWPPATAVLVDNRGILFRAVRHLVDNGHHRIAYFDGAESHSANYYQRRRAFGEALEFFGLECDPRRFQIIPFGWDEHPGAVRTAMRRFLELGRSDRPTALISHYGNQFTREARERGLSVPEDISIVSIDDARLCALTDPPLTCLATPWRSCARVVVRVLREELHDPAERNLVVSVEPDFIEGRSVANIAR